MTAQNTARTFDEVDLGAEPQPKAQAPRAGSKRPNVVIWIMDDIGYGNLSPYGGLIDMPAMQRVVDRGTRLSNFHVTPLCAPTRACLLTGRNHHTNHMGTLPRLSQSVAGKQDAQIPRENGFLSEILLQEGYATFCLGKWHLTPTKDLNPAAPKDSWPLGRGFERFHGFMAAQTSQFNPHLVADNGSLFPPPGERADYHLSEDLVDTGIRFVRELRSGSLDKPFFMYLSFGAGHTPHHAPKEWIDKYRGKFNMGWNDYRNIVHRRQKDLGLFASESPLSDDDPDVPPWADLPAEEKAVFARMMEAFAGMCTHMDHQVGRLMDELSNMGELDDTIFVVLSDNGSSSEGGVHGSYNCQQFAGQVELARTSIESLDLIGSKDAYNHYPWGWAWAGNTPFRRWKRETYRGGCAVPLVISHPRSIATGGENRDGFVHAIDLVPTILEMLHIEQPAILAGRQQASIEGVSFLSHLKDQTSPSKHEVQYFEMLGHRALYEDGWRAVCPWPAPSVKEAGARIKPGKDHRLLELGAIDLAGLEHSGWELYEVSNDPAETKNLAKSEPHRLRAMISRWWHEAGRYGVLPLLGAPLKAILLPPSKHVFYPDTAPFFIEAAPNIVNADFDIEADITLSTDRSTGMIFSHAGKFGGYALLMQDGLVKFIYNYYGLSDTVVASATRIPAGRHSVHAEFKLSGQPPMRQNYGAPGVLTLYVDGAESSSLPLSNVASGLISFSGLVTCGYHPGEAFNLNYEPPFKFDGEIHKVQVSTGGASSDEEIELRAHLSRQ